MRAEPPGSQTTTAAGSTQTRFEAGTDTAGVGDASGGEAEQPVWLAGNVGGAWRIGGTVHRPVGPWTPAVHALLGFLSPRLDHVPTVLGFDQQGREVLTFLPGRVVDVDTEVLTPGQIDSLASWTRRFHEVAAGFSHPGPWRYPHVPQASVIGHNDIAPYNVCFDGDDVAGVFDWDLAGPTTPLMELAFIAWNCVPPWRDTGDEACAERIQRICSAYGGIHPAQIVDAVPHRIQMMLDWIPLGAAAGDAGLRRLMTQGEPERSQAALNDLIPRLRRVRLLLG
jgi:Phosphotransferase enzyme family